MRIELHNCIQFSLREVMSISRPSYKFDRFFKLFFKLSSIFGLLGIEH
jgi:hypothetical protein